jgi:hypothetical protein
LDRHLQRTAASGGAAHWYVWTRYRSATAGVSSTPPMWIADITTSGLSHVVPIDELLQAAAKNVRIVTIVVHTASLREHCQNWRCVFGWAAQGSPVIDRVSLHAGRRRPRSLCHSPPRSPCDLSLRLVETGRCPNATDLVPPRTTLSRRSVSTGSNSVHCAGVAVSCRTELYVSAKPGTGNLGGVSIHPDEVRDET